MLSLYDMVLTVTKAQVVLLLGHKQFANVKVNKEIKDNNDYKERYVKTAVKAREAFSGSISDQTLWKIRTRSIFGLMGLIQVLDDRNYALLYPVKNTLVYHLLCQAVVKGTESSTFKSNFCR